jgi:predicted deacylase
MDPTTFDPAAMAPGATAVLDLDVAPLPDGQTVRLPLLVARGARPGPTMVALGGVHGDEYEGMAAVRAVFRALDPATLSGTFLGVPVCNPPAFAAAARTSPLDGLNLARAFPGRPDGTISERIAHVIETSVTARADFLIDLHSSGSRIAMPLLAGYRAGDDAAGRQARAGALCFGTPVVWAHDSVGVGRSLTGPHGRGVPWIYTECPSGGWLHPEVAAIYAEGVRNVMRLLAMLPGDPAPVAAPLELAGEGDVDRGLAAPVSGFLTLRAELLERVAAGAVLGTIERPNGALLAELRAPRAGVVVLVRRSAPVLAGEIVFLLT